MQSEHRTYDWEEADYFYVPAYTGCLMHPVFGAPHASDSSLIALQIHAAVSATAMWLCHNGGLPSLLHESDPRLYICAVLQGGQTTPGGMAPHVREPFNTPAALIVF